MARITITDVAREAGTSAQTVSRVLNGKAEITDATRRKVQEVIDRLGYRPNPIARGLVTNKTFTIGLVVPDIANPFFPQIARGIEDVAWKNGYSLILSNTGEDTRREETAIESLMDKRVDGIIVSSSRLPDRKLWQLLKQHPAAVAINRSAPANVAGTVLIDDSAGAQMATNHLLQVGRKRIGLLAGPENSISGEHRAEGYALALAAAGIDPDADWKLPCPPSPEGGLQAAAELLRRAPRIDALVCYNDLVAIGALQVCREKKLDVPGDIAIVGFDNTLLAELVHPAITSVSVDKYQVGVDTMTLLLDRIAGRETKPITHKPTLIVRSSSSVSSKKE